MRRVEGQVLREEVGSEAGSVAVETGRGPLAAGEYGFNLSFDDLSAVGLDEHRPPWNLTVLQSVNLQKILKKNQQNKPHY